MTRRRAIIGVLGGVLGAFVFCGALAFAIGWRPVIAPIDPPAAGRFDPALVRHGAELAAIGNCSACHAASGGADYAGGVALTTPFGTVFATNITPDPATGIGRWSETAFRRAMRDGVDRVGRQLYPAFPYDHFTRVNDADDMALYAFLMTRPPVPSAPRPNALVFPLGFRPLLAGWKALFFRPGQYRSDPAHDAAWNRGAYLVEGLGHCGACHTPRNALGAEERDKALSGGTAESWQAYAIDAASPAPVRWTADALAAYLRQGWQQQHGVARGPMTAVTASLADAPEADIQAIATYLAARMAAGGEHPPAPRTMLAAARPDAPGARPQEAGQQVSAVAESATEGSRIYAAACASCHESGRPLPYGGLDLHLSTAVNAPAPTNIVHVVLDGLHPMAGEPGAIMPGFRGVLNDPQIVALLAAMRAGFSDQPAWTDLAATVRRTRGVTPPGPQEAGR